MKYMLLIYHDEQSWTAQTDAERAQIYGEYRQFVQQLQTTGQHVAGEELQLAATASSVRVRDGKPLVTDGPFAETREQIGGFFVVEAKDQDEANGIASRIPSARDGVIEVRPVAVESA